VNTPGAETGLAREVLALAESEYDKLTLPGAEASWQDEDIDAGQSIPVPLQHVSPPARAFGSGRTSVATST
jgi:hypothetical protein